MPEAIVVHATLPLLQHTDFPAIRRRTLEALQVNLGYKCNQACVHCHVNAGPTRTEMMDAETIGLVLRVLAARGVRTLDITGGAPELHPGFRDLVRAARALGAHVIDRCNLTILTEPRQDDLADFLATQGVEVVASLPCYLESNVDRQRGRGVFARSIEGLRQLNARGYGVEGSGLELSLVYNPQGPVLPPAQAPLEQDYRRHLGEAYGVVFTRLYALANMPIHRFGATLVSRGQFSDYMRLLRGSHRDEHLESVMCRTLVSVDWQGRLYDCDFNQMLGIPLAAAGRPRAHLADLLDESLDGGAIAVAEHCYGCTAGQGSSCGGALA
ncbi:MAG: arsenosugar biosynthesis radical SAM protein ArsS [Gemmatimonadales bacterium]|nr:arsenosugar biosynthesis radical SAM protein ArsS [Gemmatimonadales bacterium]